MVDDTDENEEKGDGAAPDGSRTGLEAVVSEAGAVVWACDLFTIIIFSKLII